MSSALVLLYTPFRLCLQLCPQASLTNVGNITFIDEVPEDVPALQYLKEQCPCTPQPPSSSKLFLVLHPRYSWSNSIICIEVGERCSVRLPNVYAGAQVHITMNRPYPPDTYCCCCLRLDYYLTWSQLRVFGYNSQKQGHYIADWIMHMNNSQNSSFLETIGHGVWPPNTYCPSAVIRDTSTIASGNAMFDNADFDVDHALDMAIAANFTRQQYIYMTFSVTVVVALNQYCYKIKNATTSCQYSGEELRDCIYSSPQVVNTLAAGEASYIQPFYFPAGSSPFAGAGVLKTREIERKEDIECLEEFAGNESKLFHPVDNFNLNLHNVGAPMYNETSTWQPLEANYFTSEKCNHAHV